MDGRVFDVTDYIYDHPGGYEILETVKGTDAYDQFLEQKHSKMAVKQVEKFVIGIFFDKSENKSNLDKKEFIRILYATQFGNSKKIALKILYKTKKILPRNNLLFTRMDKFDLKNLFKETFIFIIISTIDSGTAPTMGNKFCKRLNLIANSNKILLDKKNLHFSIFGLCSCKNFNDCNIVANTMFKNLYKIGGKPLLPLEKNCKNTMKSSESGYTQFYSFEKWMKKLLKLVLMYLTKNTDYKNIFQREEKKIKIQLNVSGSKKLSNKRKMITPMMYKKLVKEGYQLLSSHSAVKLCRWTKIMLHDRGGCYKHIFYGIMSYRCMETTPNLSCANRCIFCWRHHTNPISKEWRWMKDSPEILLEQSFKNHYKLINMIKNSSQVKQQYFKKAHLVKHCALSLVGEPIMYPNIQDYVDLIHDKSVSTFMVTNGQFPEKVLKISAITQFYISVDAATKKNLQVRNKERNHIFN